MWSASAEAVRAITLADWRLTPGSWLSLASAFHKQRARWAEASSASRPPALASAAVRKTRSLTPTRSIKSKLLKVTHDAEIALSGATEGEPGIVMIAGTGSMAFGRNSEGRTARAGGWGYLVGDEGGGFDISRRALRAALQFEEGWGPATSLHRELLTRTGAASANDLLHRCYASISRYEFAALAPLVNECAEAGDQVAEHILVNAARALRSYVQGVHRNVFAASEPVRVSYIGGVFKSAKLRKAFSSYVHEWLGCDTVSPRLSPAAGAVIEALRMDGNHAKLTDIPETKT